MIDGITMKLAGEEFTIPPLTFKQLKAHYPLLEDMNNPETAPIKKMESIVKLTHAALSRNYPALTIERVEELVDMGNLKAVSEAVLGSSGFIARGER